MRACGVINQTLFAHDVERFVIETILRTGSFDRPIIVPHRGSLRLVSEPEFVYCWKHRVLKVAFVYREVSESRYYRILVTGTASIRITELDFWQGAKVEPSIKRRTLAGLCLPCFHDVGDN